MGSWFQSQSQPNGSLWLCQPSLFNILWFLSSSPWAWDSVCSKATFADHLSQWLSSCNESQFPTADSDCSCCSSPDFDDWSGLWCGTNVMPVYPAFVRHGATAAQPISLVLQWTEWLLLCAQWSLKSLAAPTGTKLEESMTPITCEVRLVHVYSESVSWSSTVSASDVEVNVDTWQRHNTKRAVSQCKLRAKTNYSIQSPRIDTKSMKLQAMHVLVSLYCIWCQTCYY